MFWFCCPDMSRFIKMLQDSSFFKPSSAPLCFETQIPKHVWEIFIGVVLFLPEEYRNKTQKVSQFWNLWISTIYRYRGGGNIFAQYLRPNIAKFSNMSEIFWQKTFGNIGPLYFKCISEYDNQTQNEFFACKFWLPLTLLTKHAYIEDNTWVH